METNAVVVPKGSCAIKKEKVEDLGASYKELDRDIDDKFM